MPDLAPQQSPLLEADPNSINELIQGRIDEIFNKPPLMLSDADLQAIVEYYRTQRQRFLVESQKKPPRGAHKKAPSSVSEALTASEDMF